MVKSNNDKICSTCKGEGWITSPGPNYFNCEGGGDCEKTIPNWTKEDCKTCGMIKCPECNNLLK
ncbi:MAG: hypothetical protein AABY32_04135 [Nanoarchaeota archaeon]